MSKKQHASNKTRHTLVLGSWANHGLPVFRFLFLGLGMALCREDTV